MTPFISQSSHRAISLQVWRETADSTFMLVGQVDYQILTAGVQTIKSSAVGVIRVETGDVLGMYASGPVAVPYSAGTCPDGQVYVVDGRSAQLSAGYTVTATALTSDTPCRVYSLKVTIINRESGRRRRPPAVQGEIRKKKKKKKIVATRFAC